jgi:NAD(P)-dependent dehydrogenase (short-subunit alcohol dehydrogenase family)
MIGDTWFVRSKRCRFIALFHAATNPRASLSLLSRARTRLGKSAGWLASLRPVPSSTTQFRALSRLERRVAIVTGGGGGIGGATARRLAREGASVLIADIDEEAATVVAEAILGDGGMAVAHAADLSDDAEVAVTVAAALARFGRLDIIHNNAALTDHEPLSLDTTVTDLDLEVWDRTMAVNLRSQMLMCRHAIPPMVEGGGGSIINMSSGAALKGDRTRTAYGVSKAGVNALTMYVATSHGKQGIRANTIVPGLIITEAVKAHLTEKMIEGLGRSTLTPYVGSPEDVAALVVFLASDESRYITGQMIAIDGGMSAHVGSVDR